MNGKIVSLVLFFVLISSSFMMLLPASKAIEPVRVYVDPPSVVDPPVFFNVSVKIDSVENLAGVQFNLTWNPLLLRAINMTEVMFHETTPESEWDNIFILEHRVDSIGGFAGYAYHHRDINRALNMGYLPISGNHTIATILFQVVGVGNCSLQLQKAILGTADAEPIPHENVDGFFSNSVPPPSLPPSPPDSAQVLIYAYPRRIKNESAAVSDTFESAIKLDSISNHSGLIFIRFGLEWNSTVLDCIDVNEVMFHEILPESEWQKIDWSFSIDNVLGTMECLGTFQNINVSEYAELAIFGNHTLAIVTFRIKSVGRCVLHLFDCLPIEYNPGRPNQMLYATIDGYFANTLNGDLNGDNSVDLFDTIAFAGSFGIFPGHPRWNEEADMNGDGTIDLFDAIMLGQCFGHSRFALTRWAREYGVTGRDMATALVQCSDGGYALVGSTGNDFWLVRTDVDGTMLWNHTYAGTGNDWAEGLVQTSDGGFVLAGYTDSYGAGSWDALLVKTDSAGSVQWNRTYGGRYGDVAEGLVQTSDGGYAMAGYTYSYGDLKGDFWLVKIDADGTLQWNKTYGGTSGEGAYALVQTADGGYALAGSTRSYGAGAVDFWLVKTDADGNYMWNNTYGGAGDDYAYGLVQAGDGGYLLAGYTYSFGAGGWDAWLVKTDGNGTLQWNKTYGGANWDLASDVVQTADHCGYAFAGYTYSYGGGNSDMWLVNVDAEGNVRWNSTYGGTGYECAEALVQTSDGGYAVAGFKSSETQSNSVFWLVKTNADGASLSR